MTDLGGGAGSDPFDLVVIGSGPAGEKGAAQAAYHGYRVAVVERRPPPRPDTVAVLGGIPVKALRDTAMYLSGWARRDTYGVGITLAPDLVMDRLRARTADVVSTMAQAASENLERHRVELVRGDARLGPDRRVLVQLADGGDRELRGRVILLATGSHPHHPPEIPFSDPDVHDSETVLDIARLPERMLVVGGGPVGSEYASIFAALGVQITLVDRHPDLLPMLDAELSQALAQTLTSAGVRLLMKAQVESVGRDDQGPLVVVDGEPFHPQVVVHAVGRVGNVEGLGLDQAGVDVGPRGRIRVGPDFQTSAPGIYAAGDVIGPPGLASVAMEQARVAICRAFGIHFKEAVDPVVPTGIYTLPETSMVGLTEGAALAAGEEVECGRTLFASNARARIAGSTDGLLKLVFRVQDRRLLGAHILGEEANELIHVAQALMHRGGTVDEFIDTTFNFPTRADAYKYAAYDGLQHLDERLARREAQGTR
ncbi:MAG: FAD-dependent oxidoreductase [Candidatus Dormibacteria bacterium]